MRSQLHFCLHYFTTMKYSYFTAKYPLWQSELLLSSQIDKINGLMVIENCKIKIQYYFRKTRLSPGPLQLDQLNNSER